MQPHGHNLSCSSMYGCIDIMMVCWCAGDFCLGPIPDGCCPLPTLPTMQYLSIYLLPYPLSTTELYPSVWTFGGGAGMEKSVRRRSGWLVLCVRSLSLLISLSSLEVVGRVSYFYMVHGSWIMVDLGHLWHGVVDLISVLPAFYFLYLRHFCWMS
jgi:hypothetical protein